MKLYTDHPRMNADEDTCAATGVVIWSPSKSLWYLFHLGFSIYACAYCFSWSSFLVFLIFTALTLCFGHSLGMHRRFIHNSFECPLWLEYLFVHLGVLVGLAGPLGMMKQHDLRDWAQRQKKCHSYLRHGKSFIKDGWWQLHCDLVLDKAPSFIKEDRIRNDVIYAFMEKTWALQQLPWGLLLYYFGGASWLVWGISVRITVSITGHWLIGFFAHNQGIKNWHVNNAAVQGYNVPFTEIITMGESLHNNHHAFPGSAKLSVYDDELDLGWGVLLFLRRIGLVWNLVQHNDISLRKELIRV